jgi:hypothetical protein
MKHKGLAAVLFLGCAALAGVSAYLYLGTDRQAPVISVNPDLTYIDGEDESQLLEGVTATDKEDGDLTDQIFISKIEKTGDGRVIITYAVKDKANNVGKASCRLRDETPSEETEEENTEEASSLTPEPTKTPEATQSPEPTKTPEESSTEETASDSSSEDTEDELVQEGSSPAIALLIHKKTIKVGESFEPLGMVKGVADDADDESTLYSDIYISGEYDVNTPGSYELSYYVMDSDGNISDAKQFTLTVEQ